MYYAERVVGPYKQRLAVEGSDKSGVALRSIVTQEVYEQESVEVKVKVEAERERLYQEEVSKAESLLNPSQTPQEFQEYVHFILFILYCSR